ncbi:MAG: hypothetical protein ACJAY5_002004, partial [Actinomycetes bacterium]
MVRGGLVEELGGRFIGWEVTGPHGCGRTNDHS